MTTSTVQHSTAQDITVQYSTAPAQQHQQQQQQQQQQHSTAAHRALRRRVGAPTPPSLFFLPHRFSAYSCRTRTMWRTPPPLLTHLAPKQTSPSVIRPMKNSSYLVPRVVSALTAEPPPSVSISPSCIVRMDARCRSQFISDPNGTNAPSHRGRVQTRPSITRVMHGIRPGNHKPPSRVVA